MFAWSIDTLIVGRIIQGVGTGALLPLSRVIVQDSVSKDKFIQIVSWISLFFMLAPAGAPVIGGLIQTYANWCVSFLVTFGLFLVSTVAAMIPEKIVDYSIIIFVMSLTAFTLFSLLTFKQRYLLTNQTACAS